MNFGWSSFAPRRLLPKGALWQLKHAAKTAIAALAALGVSKVVAWPESYWAVISAVIVMQSNIGGSVRASWSRLAGTAIGAATGGIMAAAWVDSPWAMAAAIVVAVLICSSLGMQDSLRLASVTVVIVMIVPGGSPWLVSLQRFLQVSLGIVVALAVSLKIWPSRASERLREGLSEALEKLSKAVDQVARSYLDGKAADSETLGTEIEAILRRNEALIDDAQREPDAYGRRSELRDIARRIEDFYTGILMCERIARSSSSNVNEDSIHVRVGPELKRLCEAVRQALGLLARSLDCGDEKSRVPDLIDPVASIEVKLLEMRRTGATVAYPLAEVEQFFSFFFGLKDLVRQTGSLREAVGRFRKHGDANLLRRAIVQL